MYKDITCDNKNIQLGAQVVNMQFLLKLKSSNFKLDYYKDIC